MNPNQALWEKGDFTRIAATMRDSGEALVKELAITNGLEVLDLGCGDGTTALPGREARRERAGCRHRPQPRGSRERPSEERRPHELHVPGRRRDGPARSRG